MVPHTLKQNGKRERTTNLNSMCIPGYAKFLLKNIRDWIAKFGRPSSPIIVFCKSSCMEPVAGSLIHLDGALPIFVLSPNFQECFQLIGFLCIQFMSGLCFLQKDAEFEIGCIKRPGVVFECAPDGT